MVGMDLPRTSMNEAEAGGGPDPHAGSALCREDPMMEPTRLGGMVSLPDSGVSETPQAALLSMQARLAGKGAGPGVSDIPKTEASVSDHIEKTMVAPAKRTQRARRIRAERDRVRRYIVDRRKRVRPDTRKRVRPDTRKRVRPDTRKRVRPETRKRERYDTRKRVTLDTSKRVRPVMRSKGETSSDHNSDSDIITGHSDVATSDSD